MGARDSVGYRLAPPADAGGAAQSAVRAVREGRVTRAVRTGTPMVRRIEGDGATNKARRARPRVRWSGRWVLAALGALDAGRPWRAHEVLLRAAEAVPGLAGTAEHALLSDAPRPPAVEFVRRHGPDAVPPRG